MATHGLAQSAVPLLTLANLPPEGIVRYTFGLLGTMFARVAIALVSFAKPDAKSTGRATASPKAWWSWPRRNRAAGAVSVGNGSRRRARRGRIAGGGIGPQFVRAVAVVAVGTCWTFAFSLASHLFTASECR